jgi:hypothetical protein
MKKYIYALTIASIVSLQAMERDKPEDKKRRAEEEPTAELQPPSKKFRAQDLSAISMPQLLEYVFTLEEEDARAHLKKLPHDLVEKLTEYAAATPFIRAIEDGRIHAIRLLLNVFNADVTHKNIYGYTPLQLACANCASAVPLILEAAKRHFFKIDEFLAVHESLKNKGTDSQITLVGHNGEFTKLRTELKSYINYFAPDGYTALHLACRHQAEAIPLLLEEDSDPNSWFMYYEGPDVPDGHCDYPTPLMEAAKNKAAVPYIPQLLEVGARAWTYTGVSGSEAIQYALMFENIEAVEYLARYMATDQEPGSGREWGDHAYVSELIALAEKHIKNADALERARSILSKDYSAEMPA